jgi:hypothetical protein
VTTDEATGLGAVLSRHHVDNERRQVIGVWALGIGLFGAVVSMIMVVPEDTGPYQPVQGQTEGAVIGLTLSALVIGSVYLGKALLGGDEYFEVRENGLVHAFGRNIWRYPWDQVAYVRVWRTPREEPIGHCFGSQYRGTIVLTNRRRRLRFNGLTDRYEKLGAALMKNCAPAPRTTRRKRLAWLGLAVVSGGLVAFLVWYITAHPDTERRIEREGYTEIVSVPGISDTGMMFIGGGLVVSAALVIAFVALALRRD